MKKCFSLLLMLSLLFTTPLAVAEDALDTRLEGFVTEILEGGFLLHDVDMGDVVLNVDATTVWDGDISADTLAVGLYVLVDYDGRMTRSLPPQAHADRVGCYIISGNVGGFLENGILVENDERFGTVIVRLEPQDMPHLFLNVPVKVYYNGVMALSEPGQVNAKAIEVPKLEGVVTEWVEPETEATPDETPDETAEKTPDAEPTEPAAPASAEAEPVPAEPASSSEPTESDTTASEPVDAEVVRSFLLTAEDGQQYLIHLTQTTLVGELLPAQEESLLAPSDEPSESEASTKKGSPTASTEPEEPAPAEAAAIAPILWDVGDRVTVYYSGALTRSIPAAAVALEVIVLR